MPGSFHVAEGGTPNPAMPEQMDVPRNTLNTRKGKSGLQNFRVFRVGPQEGAAGLIRGSDGALYGLASAGGDFHAGTVFRLVPPPLTVMPPVFSSIVRLAGGNVSMTLNVTPNATYSLQSSSDLVSWTVQTNVFATGTTIQVSDLTATQAATRFYRAVWRP